MFTSSSKLLIFVLSCSDQMGNKGAFITMGVDMKPNYTTYDAVVSICELFNKCQKGVCSWLVRSRPDPAVRVRVLAAGTLCCVGQDTLLTVPLYAQVYKWVPANLISTVGNPR